MKRIITVASAAFAVFIAGHFVPFSLRGPAMSCFTAGHEDNAGREVAEFAASHNHELSAVATYMTNSDFKIRNIPVRGNKLALVFVKDTTNSACLLFDLMAIDGTLVAVQLISDDRNDFYRVSSVK
jgi:hypothetical protein